MNAHEPFALGSAGHCDHRQTVTRPHGPHLGLYCALCGRWLKWVPKPVTLEEALTFVMPFGKHRGRRLGDLSDVYLDGLYEHCKARRVAEMARLVYESRGGDT